MYREDISLLCCPKTKEDLVWSVIYKEDNDGDVIEGELVSGQTGHVYKVKNGIPRFVDSLEYNKSWDYKWTVLDAGRGLNYLITDKNDSAYSLHDLFDKNSYGGDSHSMATGKVALDIGCGVGQYSWRLVNEFKPRKMISMDLTHGVDIFRKIMLERFPEHKKTILIVQGDVFCPPFKDSSIDYVMSLGVLMHTGNTKKAIENAAKLVVEEGFLNIWVYASLSVAYDWREPDRGATCTTLNVIPEQLRQLIVFAWVKLINALPHELAMVIMKLFSSTPVYLLTRIPLLGKIVEFFIPRVRHPNRDYRLINLYDWFRNNWGDTWGEHEIFPVLKANGIVLKGISKWRVGMFGKKLSRFYHD